MRAGYLLMGVGLALVEWRLLPDAHTMPLYKGVTVCWLTAMSLFAFLGLRCPVTLPPLLLLETTWKLLWLAQIALPEAVEGNVDAATADTVFSCPLVIVIIAVIPWGQRVANLRPSQRRPVALTDVDHGPMASLGRVARLLEPLRDRLPDGEGRRRPRGRYLLLMRGWIIVVSGVVFCAVTSFLGDTSLLLGAVTQSWVPYLAVPFAVGLAAVRTTSIRAGLLGALSSVAMVIGFYTVSPFGTSGLPVSIDGIYEYAPLGIITGFMLAAISRSIAPRVAGGPAWWALAFCSVVTVALTASWSFLGWGVHETVTSSGIVVTGASTADVIFCFVCHRSRFQFRRDRVRRPWSVPGVGFRM